MRYFGSAATRGRVAVSVTPSVRGLAVRGETGAIKTPRRVAHRGAESRDYGEPQPYHGSPSCAPQR